jgi:hypothetical protein
MTIHQEDGFSWIKTYDNVLLTFSTKKQNTLQFAPVLESPSSVDDANVPTAPRRPDCAGIVDGSSLFA